jgi:CheY-like chemotaxis protein
MKPTILCIEDNQDNMMLISRIFRPDSYLLVEARSGMQGLGVAESRDIDVILLDINLPDIDGYEVARRIRSSAKLELGRVPIVAITANALKDDANRCLNAGCNIYMSKPIDIQDLWDTVEALLSSKHEDR